jgi:hypothetical protein
MNLQRRAKTRLGGTVALPKIRCMGIRWHMNDAQWCRVMSLEILESILRADVANSVLTLPTHVRKITLSLAPIQICALVCRHHPASLCGAARGMTWTKTLEETLDAGWPRAPSTQDPWFGAAKKHFYTMQTLEDRCFSILYMFLFTFWFDHKIPWTSLTSTISRVFNLHFQDVWENNSFQIHCLWDKNLLLN